MNTNEGHETDMPVLSARALKAYVEDLFGPDPRIFWADLLASTAVTYAAIIVYLRAVAWSAPQIVAFLIAALGLFRITTFMHEIVHLRRGHMRTFKLAWNVLVGIPLLTPSLFYTSHADHHSNRYYGTPGDGEYLPFARMAHADIGRFFATLPFVPVFAVLRALVLVPVSVLVPRMRHWLLARASAAVISPNYRRRHVPAIRDPLWLVSDVACFAYAATIAALAFGGFIPLAALGKLYVLIVFALALNWLRTLAAHRYRNDGRELSHGEQVLDSLNVTGSPLLTELLYPVGLRYHALHHLLPSLPYHALGTAHRRLTQALPPDSPYHAVSVPNTRAALRQLWRDAADGRESVAMRRHWREA